MTLKYLCVAIAAVLLALVNTTANAGETVDQGGTIVCVNDKWDEKEPEPGHKLVDLVQRCAIIPNDPAQPKFVQDCVGKYEYMPDKSWKASGTCTDNIGKEKRYETWEEGSHLGSELIPEQDLAVKAHLARLVCSVHGSTDSVSLCRIRPVMRAIERDFPLTLITNNNVLGNSGKFAALTVSHFVLLLSHRAQDHLELEGDFGSSLRLAL